MIVIDASALAKYILREDNWFKVREVLRKEAFSIDHVLKEVANAIWRKTKILGLGTIDDALARYNILRKIIDEQIIVLEDEMKYIDHAFNIALEHNITVYDALYIAQAVELNATLVTSDRKQAGIARKLGVRTHYIP